MLEMIEKVHLLFRHKLEEPHKKRQRNYTTRNQISYPWLIRLMTQSQKPPCFPGHGLTQRHEGGSDVLVHFLAGGTGCDPANLSMFTQSGPMCHIPVQTK